MAELHLYDVIRRPLITEKTAEMVEAQNKYVFEVARNANKIQVKEAVEEIFRPGRKSDQSQYDADARQARPPRPKLVHPVPRLEEGHRHAGRRRVDRAL